MTLPLEGLRVLDFSMVWAGPYATKLLADMGAEVIKVESPARMDPIRMATIEIFMLKPPDMNSEPWNRSAYFNEYNRNKQSLVIDTVVDEGRAVIEELVRRADVLVENFRPGVLARLGYGDDVVFALNPRLTRVSMPAYASSGSEARQVGYGPNIEEMAGLTRLNGYPDGPPLKTGISFGDPMAGVMASAGAMLGVLGRERTGRGTTVEVSQRNTVIPFAGDAVMEWAMNGTEAERTGNRSTRYAPQGAYPCLPLPPDEARHLDVYHSAGQGEEVRERWVAVTVRDDREFGLLCAEMGHPEVAEDERFATVEQRLAHHDELDEVISEWTSTLSDVEVTVRLQARGIASGPVLSLTDVGADPHLWNRAFFHRVDHPAVGSTVVTSSPWRLGRSEPADLPAPTFGQHNHQILRDLGYTEDRIQQLTDAGVIATAPRM